MQLELVPITLREALAFVAEHHRHHKRWLREFLDVAERAQKELEYGNPLARSGNVSKLAEKLRETLP